MDFLFSIPILTTAISIVICWAMYAIFCSMIHEAVTLLKGERGKFMKKWLLKQLFDHPNGVNWASMLYLHGSIDLLSRATTRPTSDIESRLFAETLIEVVGNSRVVQMNKGVVKDRLKYESELLNNFKAATLVLKPSDVVSLMQKSMQAAELCSTPGVPNEVEIYKCLVAQIQHWYNEMGERLSYWYKKKTRARLFTLGVLFGAILNIDSFQLYHHFSENKESKKVLIEYYEANAEKLSQLAGEVSDSSLDIRAHEARIRDYSRKMDSVAKVAELPIGWEFSPLNSAYWKNGHRKEAKEKPVTFWTVLWFVLFSKIPGILLSGLAASFGGPFWFDLLRKVYDRKPKTSA